MPVRFSRVWLHSAGLHLPGEPVDNERIGDYIEPLNRLSDRIRRRILQENGIRTRHYAIGTDGQTRISHAALAAAAIRDCLDRHPERQSAARAELAPTLLAVGSSGGDALVPGFALAIQGELGLPPLQTLSSQGVCAAGVSAIEFAAQGIELGSHARALAVAAEMPSRLFKRSRFAPRGYHSDFDAHFLRWMLSDGAGALAFGDRPVARPDGLAIRLDWVHQKSFAGDYPVCMQLGLTEDRQRSFLDFDSASEAEAAGALSLRQDIRLLPHLFDVAIHEHLTLVRDGLIDPARTDHFLCHYSSQRFQPDVAALLDKAGSHIAPERWYSNLQTRGNTGAASIFVMLADFLATRPLRPGQRILCFVPESGRISVAFMQFSVHRVAADDVVADATATGSTTTKSTAMKSTAADSGAMDAMAVDVKRTDSDGPVEADMIAPPHDPGAAPGALRDVLTELAVIWQDYRSRVWRTPLVRRIVTGRLAVPDYAAWAGQWVPQVREGSRWMREAATSVTGPLQPLAALIALHASDEQNDFQILYDDYRRAGGRLPLDDLRRNPGGDALNAFLHGMAATADPVGLLGAIYVIEGTGQRIVPALLPMLRRQLPLPESAFRFLAYHGANDEHHLARWLGAVEIALAADPRHAEAIVATARRTASLYLLQFELVLAR